MRIIPVTSSLLFLLIFAGTVSGQSSEQQKDQQQNQPKEQPQSSPQDATQTATPEQPQQDSVAEAARKAKLKKNQTAKGKVFTEEDLARMHGGVSVIGPPAQESSASAATTKDATTDAGKDAKDDKKEEDSWRERSRKIHEQMDAIDQQIKNLQDDIKKNGSSGFDMQKGLKDNVVYLQDKTAQLNELNEKRHALEKRLDDLQEEARKAGVPPDWVR